MNLNYILINKNKKGTDGDGRATRHAAIRPSQIADGDKAPRLSTRWLLACSQVDQNVDQNESLTDQTAEPSLERHSDPEQQIYNAWSLQTPGIVRLHCPLATRTTLPPAENRSSSGREPLFLRQRTASSFFTTPRWFQRLGWSIGSNGPIRPLKGIWETMVDLVNQVDPGSEIRFNRFDLIFKVFWGWLEALEKALRSTIFNGVGFKARKPHYSCYTWLALNGGLKTADELIKRNIGVNSLCSLCFTFNETAPHLLFECDYAFAILKTLIPSLGDFLLGHGWIFLGSKLLCGILCWLGRSAPAPVGLPYPWMVFYGNGVGSGLIWTMMLLPLA
ncbi:hypothetical protein M5K25_017840 [Dendrobium thyrsiflorum]|uniref:Reverse transcriptase zinc-binding domain-containing protein n=1 Tax=Dendrobium thyrsiflorum TaxID=117978 RepID=A0ABD0UH37_DENTH